MNNNFNHMESFKNFLTNYNPNIKKVNGLKINDKIKLIESDKPREEIVTLLFMYDKPIKEKKDVIFPFLCNI